MAATLFSLPLHLHLRLSQVPGLQLLLIGSDNVPLTCSSIEVQYMDVQMQEGKSDCGVFAIVFAAASYTHFQDPASIIYDQAKMRTHLIHCFETRSMTPFPSCGSCNPLIHLSKPTQYIVCAT